MGRSMHIVVVLFQPFAAEYLMAAAWCDRRTSSPSDAKILEQPFFKRVAGFATGMYPCGFFPPI